MDKKYWILTVVSVFVVLIGAISLINTATEEIESLPDHIKGSPNASVALVEYSDFQCPACSIYAPFINQLAKDYPEDLKIIYKHFPLNIHPNSREAAYASEAAGVQGKFWEMHDMLFTNQTSWSRQSRYKASTIFEEYAKEIGLDVDKYKKDVGSKAVKKKVEENEQESSDLKLNSTPSFYLNGEKIENPRSYDAFSEMVKAEIDNSKASK